MFHTETYADESTARKHAVDSGDWFVKSIYRDCMGWWKVEFTKYESLAMKGSA